MRGSKLGYEGQPQFYILNLLVDTTGTLIINEYEYVCYYPLMCNASVPDFIDFYSGGDNPHPHGHKAK